jgi:hypothetical protein
MENQNIKKYRAMLLIVILSIVELVLLVCLFSFFSSPVIGTGNTTVVVPTSLSVGTVYPEVVVVNVTDNTGVNITLNADSTDIVYCNGVLRDYTNKSYITNATAEFFWKNTSFYGDADDNNTHYTNSTCTINSSVVNPSYGDDSSGNYTANVTCSFVVQYYANYGNWNCTIYVYDIYNNNGTNSNTGGVNQLLAISLPSSINYGSVNATSVSNENITNVTNVGNVAINLTLNGYGSSPGDGTAMNCTQGSSRNISIMYEKYNLTGSTSSVTGLTDFESKYTNLTNATATKRFSLYYRLNDSANDAINSTYWRIYVPRGVSGTCQGNIIFAATTAAGS